MGVGFLLEGRRAARTVVCDSSLDSWAQTETLFMSLLEAKRYGGGGQGVSLCQQPKSSGIVWGQAEQTKPAPGLRCCGCPRVPGI